MYLKTMLVKYKYKELAESNRILIKFKNNAC